MSAKSNDDHDASLLILTMSYELKPMKPPVPPRHPEASLGASYRQAEEKAKATVHLERGLDAVSIWGLAASGW